MENADNGLYLPPRKKWKLRKILSVEYLTLSGFGSLHLNTTRIQRKNRSFLKSIPHGARRGVCTIFSTWRDAAEAEVVELTSFVGEATLINSNAAIIEFQSFIGEHFL